MTQEIRDESTSPPQSSAVVQRKTRDYRFVRGWITRYGLQPQMSDIRTGEVLSASCRFCLCFNRETTEDDSTNRKRQKTQSVKVWKKPFRSDNIRKHIEDHHFAKFKEYQHLTDELKRDFFKQDSIFFTTALKRRKTNPDCFFIDKQIVDDLLLGLYFGDDENESKQSVLERFSFNEDRNLYEYACNNGLQFRLVVHAVGEALSFNQTSSVLSSVRSQTGNAEMGFFSKSIVINHVRAVVALNSQGISRLLEKNWCFSIAFDMGNKSNCSYLAVRLRLMFKGELHNVHLVAMPLNVRHTGENMANAIESGLKTVCKGWKKKLISISSDGASNDTGPTSGAVSRLQERASKVCSAPFFRTWCGLHQLDLLVKKLLTQLQEEEFIYTITHLSNYLRRQINFSLQHSKCPSYVETRWTSLSTVVEWLKNNRRIVQDFLVEKRVRWRPGSVFWVLVHIVCEFLEPVVISFRKLQGQLTTVEDQEKAFADLQDELAELTQARRIINSTQTQSQEPETELASIQRQGTWELRREDADVFISDLSSWVKEAFESLNEYDADNVLSDILSRFGGCLQ